MLLQQADGQGECTKLLQRGDVGLGEWRHALACAVGWNRCGVVVELYVSVVGWYEHKGAEVCMLASLQ